MIDWRNPLTDALYRDIGAVQEAFSAALIQDDIGKFQRPPGWESVAYAVWVSDDNKRKEIRLVTLPPGVRAVSAFNTEEGNEIGLVEDGSDDRR